MQTNKDKTASTPPVPPQAATNGKSSDVKTDPKATAPTETPKAAAVATEAKTDASREKVDEEEEKTARAKRKYHVITKATGELRIFDSKPEMLKFLNSDPAAPKFGEFTIIAGVEITLRQTVALG